MERSLSSGRAVGQQIQTRPAAGAIDSRKPAIWFQLGMLRDANLRTTPACNWVDHPHFGG